MKVIYLKRNVKTVILLSSLLMLASCDDNNSLIHEGNGYTVKVTYDLGDGVYELENAERVHTLDLYYQPNSPITDFSDSVTYKFYNGSGDTAMTFDGFYLDDEFTQKLDTSTFRLTDKDITVYAKWIGYDFEIYYQPEGKTEFEKLGFVRDKVNSIFSYSKSWGKANDLYEGYTLIGAYSDKEMTTSIVDDENFKVTLEENKKTVYTKWVKGDYEFINSVDEFLDKLGESMYLNCDIDLTDKKISYVSLNGKTILGNNHKITNLVVDTTGRDGKGNSAVGGLFRQIKDSTIKDLTIEGSFTLNPTLAQKMYFATLSGTATNMTLDNVNINATYSVANTKIELLVSENRYAYTEKECKITNSSIKLTKIEKE